MYKREKKDLKENGYFIIKNFINNRDIDDIKNSVYSIFSEQFYNFEKKDKVLSENSMDKLIARFYKEKNPKKKTTAAFRVCRGVFGKMRNRILAFSGCGTKRKLDFSFFTLLPYEPLFDIFLVFDVFLFAQVRTPQTCVMKLGALIEAHLLQKSVWQNSLEQKVRDVFVSPKHRFGTVLVLFRSYPG